MTNHERFQHMSVEEMADFLLGKGVVIGWCLTREGWETISYQPKEQREMMVDWLNQEVRMTGVEKVVEEL